METSQYQCTSCKGTFDKEWTDEEAMNECIETLGSIPSDETLDVICDDCYNKFMEWYNRRPA